MNNGALIIEPDNSDKDMLDIPKDQLATVSLRASYGATQSIRPQYAQVNLEDISTWRILCSAMYSGKF